MTRWLIVDDDITFAQTVAQKITAHGFLTSTAHSMEEALLVAKANPPQRVLTDLNMPGGNGLELVAALHAMLPQVPIVVLTGFATIATAVEAIKLGAVHYLTKPVSTQEIIDAFEQQSGHTALPIASAATLVETEKETILRTLARHGGNISAAARELGLYRRTLQRKLDKLR